MLTDHPIYPKHPIRPGTDEAKIRAWKRRHRMIECEGEKTASQFNSGRI